MADQHAVLQRVSATEKITIKSVHDSWGEAIDRFHVLDDQRIAKGTSLSDTYFMVRSTDDPLFLRAAVDTHLATTTNG